MPAWPSSLAPLLLVLLLVPTCRPQGDVLVGSNRSVAVESGSLILMVDSATQALTSPTTALAGVTAPVPVVAKKRDGDMMIQYRRFQRPQRRDLPVAGLDLDTLSPACEQFNTDEPMPGDRKAIVFKTPNYPNNYPNNTDCVRRLTADPGHLLQLDFRDSFHIEPSEGCRFDYLEVRDGAHGYSTLRGMFCGQTFPPILTSSDRYFWLRFHSDENIEYKGFKAVYWQMPRPTSEYAQPELEMCSFNITGQAQGYINRSDIDRLDPQRVAIALEHKLALDCMWVIHVDEGWKIHVNFINFKLEKPNDCESNFVDVFPARTDLQSRIRNFCGSIADAVTSDSNIMHIRFYADHTAKNSTFDTLFTAFREKGTGTCEDGVEWDCEDNTCIVSELRCNGVHNCRFKWDEEDCKPKSGSFLAIISSSEQLIIIMVIFCLLVFGMCFAFVYNCICKLLRDHRIIQEHMRQSREDRLDEMGRKSPSMSRHCSQHSSEHDHVHDHEHDHDPELSAETTPTARRHRQDCYLAGTDDAMLPMLLSRGSLPAPPTNGDAVFVRPGAAGASGCPAPGHGSLASSHRGHSGSRGAMAADEDIHDAQDGALPPPPMPEMRDMECQTRESLFHNHSSSLSNHSGPSASTATVHDGCPGPGSASRSNSERSSTPPPPPPPTAARLVNMKNSRNVPRPAPFSTFGYADDGHGPGQGHGHSHGPAATLSRRPLPAPGPPQFHHHHHHRHEDPMRFRAEAVIEMDQKSSSSSSAGGGGGGGGGPERPFSMDSTKSAPDVIVTH